MKPPYRLRRLLQRIMVAWIALGFMLYDALEPRRSRLRTIRGGRAAHPAD